MLSPGPVARKAASDAVANIGVTEEGGNNRGRYIRIYLAAVSLFSPNPWCMAFCIYRLRKAAEDLRVLLPKDMPLTGSTTVFANWSKSKGLFIPVEKAKLNPKLVARGDLCFFYNGLTGRMRHVGIVTQVHDWGVTTVEGNTGPGAGVNADGDGVFEKQRKWSNLASKGGFARLPF